jgi:anti-sigma regulatory factor (Ser/Thr protein kinase)
VTGGAPLQMLFSAADLPRLRLRVGDAAAAAGLDENRCEELVLAVYELACNAILHGGGGGYLELSRADGSVRCQVADDGPGFAGTEAPSGGGLWLAGQLTDGIEVDDGTANGGGAVVTLMVRCHSDSRQPSE